MARLTHVYRSDDMSEITFGRRQLPLSAGDNNLMMLMDLTFKGLVYDHCPVKGKELEDFMRKFNILSADELKQSLEVSSTEFISVLSQSVPCVGCRRSVERLYCQLTESGHPTLNPVAITPHGVLTVTEDILKSPQAICTLLYQHNALLNSLLENQPRNKKSLRCGLHSLDSFRTRPFTDIWRDAWNSMRQNCREEIAVIKAQDLHATMDGYLKKHKFCQECRTKVEKAYSLLVSEANPVKEKGYVAALYANIKKCIINKRIHLQTRTEFIDSLIKRAEPELNGSNSRHRERHAKTLEIAQEEVLTCIGMCIYERLRRIYSALKEEENACQVLAAVAVHTLCRNFDTAVENKRGITNLELLYQEISRAERVKELRKEQKKLKKKKKKMDKKQALTDCEMCKPMEENDDDEEEVDCHSQMVDGHTNTTDCSCINYNDVGADCVDGGGGKEMIVRNVNDGGVLSIDRLSLTCTLNDDENHDELKDEISVLSCHSCEQNGCTKSIDGGYGSEPMSQHDSSSCCALSSNLDSRASSLVSSPEGSEVACSDGFCNHDGGGGHGHSHRATPECSDLRFFDTDGFHLSLSQMLDDLHSDDELEDVQRIPDEIINDYKCREADVRKTREALRQNLRQRFNQLCQRNRNCSNL